MQLPAVFGFQLPPVVACNDSVGWWSSMIRHFFMMNWWTCEEHDGPLVNLGAPLCTSFIKLCIGDMNLYQQYINIFLSDMFLTYNPHACLAKCQFVVSFWRWVRTYILCSYTTYTHCMYAYTGRYVHKHDNHKHMYIYICINNYI